MKWHLALNARRMGMLGGLAGVIASPAGDPFTCVITGGLGFVAGCLIAKLLFKL